MQSRIKTDTQASTFHVIVTGQIESAIFPSHIDSIYCRYALSFGIDWDIIHGVNSGITQVARRSNGRDQKHIVWNFPIDVAFKSSNAYGWPRITLGIYGLDLFGRDVVRGYGSLLIPTTPGRYTKNVQTYTPISGSACVRFTNWIAGTLPEYRDLKFTAKSDGRAVTRVKTEGVVKIILNVTTKEMENFGFVLDRNVINSTF